MMSFGLGRQDHMVTLGLGGARVYGPSGTLGLVVCLQQKTASRAALSGASGTATYRGYPVPPVTLSDNGGLAGSSDNTARGIGVSTSSAVLSPLNREPPVLFRHGSCTLRPITREAIVNPPVSGASAPAPRIESVVLGARAEGSEDGNCE